MKQASGWDCHTHVFGPYQQFALAAERAYTPPEATLSQHQAMLARQGLSHGVLVHPSAYGTDTSLLEHALEQHPTLRGVVVVQADTHVDLQALRVKGVRAARFSHRSGAGSNFAGSASLADLTALAPRLAEAGLHAELWTDCQVLPSIADQLNALPVPVVVDHMGGFDVSAGVDEPGFQCLLALLDKGNTWVKLSAYRNLSGHADMERGAAFHQALVQTQPQRLLWGSDWPHLRVTPSPEPEALLQVFKRWTHSEALVQQILITNPEALYL